MNRIGGLPERAEMLKRYFEKYPEKIVNLINIEEAIEEARNIKHPKRKLKI